MKAARKFMATLEPLDARRVPGSVHYHLVPVVGRGVMVQTYSAPATTGGGTQVVDTFTGRATDLGVFTGAITYTVPTGGGPVTGMGEFRSVHSEPRYLLTFVLSGTVLTAAPYTKSTSDAFIFNVTGGTRRFAFASGQGQITAADASHPHHIPFRIDAFLKQLT